MSRKVITDRGEYTVGRCTEVFRGVEIELHDNRALYEIAEEFDTITSLRFEDADKQITREFECPLKLQDIHSVNEDTRMVRLMRNKQK